MEQIIDTPILFLVFNRPEKTKKVFDIIRSVKPSKLYVTADAPRIGVNEDQAKCQAVRNIVKQVDWECDAKYLFHEQNQGCSFAGKSAWDWFFSYEDKMIFIEDDGLISKSFFGYCQELLNKYEHDDRIAYISGINYGKTYGNYSYFFSRFGGGTYASATWKRVYDLYEYKLESYSSVRHKKDFRNNFINKFAFRITDIKFRNYIKMGSNTYDLQMVYLVHKHNMFNIVPNTNLCSNIGFDEEATNFNGRNQEMIEKFGKRVKKEILEIKHPPTFFIDPKFEKEYFKTRVLYDHSKIASFYYFLFRPLFFLIMPVSILSILRKMKRKII